MSHLRHALLFTGVLALGVLAAAPASAQTGEISLVVGTVLGDDLEIDDEMIRASFDDSPLYGGRVGVYGYPWGLEGSVVVGPSGLSGDEIELEDELDVRVVYAEGNVLLIPIPGPISPFVTGGVGIHSFKFEGGAVDVTENKLGFNYGGGVKANIGPVGLRADVRDHVTPFDAGDLGPILEPILDVEGDESFHNWEISGGISFRF